MPHDALLDPQGKAVTQAMGTIGLNEIQDVRIGRHIRLFVDANDADMAKAKVEEACKKMLANAIMESYSFSIEAV
ncbi:MAG: phosphoribosylformylglycinamidine synthase subunit PurS [Bacteroidota bacterium]